MNRDERLTVTIQEAATMLGISRNLAYGLAKAGAIPSLKLGSRRILVPKKALENMLSQGGNIA